MIFGQQTMEKYQDDPAYTFMYLFQDSAQAFQVPGVALVIAFSEGPSLMSSAGGFVNLIRKIFLSG